MIQGIGVDIIKIERIKKAIERSGQGFLNRVFTPEEQNYCLKMKNKFQHFAVRFAAKEAVLKALGLGWNSIRWTSIEVVNDEDGSPEVTLHDKIRNMSTSRMFISLSHFEEYAIAFVILEKRGGKNDHAFL